MPQNTNLSVVGAQWGDEGKGKVVDYFAEHADVVVRFAGGNNAGHTIVVDDQQLAVHLLPSAVAREGAVCVLGDGMVIDPDALLAEIDQLAAAGLTLPPERLRVGRRAHLVLPHHRQLDELREARAGALGTTRRGIGPAYEDKAARRGLRVGDLVAGRGRLAERLERAIADAQPRIARLGGSLVSLEEQLESLLAAAGRLAPYVEDTSEYLWRRREEGKRLLFEGAQGILLDLDHGTYPFVTSSCTLPSGACCGSGVAPNAIGRLVGVAKAYLTRVGEGPFPTEAPGEAGERLGRVGHEFGTTTGRARRCGWLDLVALRYAARVAGLQALALTKLDVLGGISTIPVCVAYRLGGRELDRFPDDPQDLAAVEPVYRELPGFPTIADDARDMQDLPQRAREYVETIEREVGLPVVLISVGPARSATIVRQPIA